MSHTILVVDDNADNLAATRFLLEDNGYEVQSARSGDEAIETIRSATRPYSIVILDYHMPGKNGADTAVEIRAIDSKPFLLMYSGDDESREPIKAAWEAGAVQFIEKGTESDTLLSTVQQLCTKYDQTRRTLVSRPSLSENERLLTSFNIVGRSSVMADLARKIKKFNDEDASASVLIRGENGVGKEVIAKAFHYSSSRRSHAFVAVNCGAIPENLIESELFGHEKGSFTSADQKKAGKFLTADRGTIFLDEIGEATPQTQVKLLRVLQEHSFTPVGSNRELKVDVRVIAATNRDLEKAIQEGKFREDLYYRLKVIPLVVPPLRERPEDIEPLIAHFCREYNRNREKKKTFLTRTVRLMEGYSWPGNVRELENYVRSLLMETNCGEITPDHLESFFFSNNVQENLTLALLEKRHEKEKADYIKSVLTTSSFREAARKIGVKKSTLYNMAKRLGIKLDKQVSEGR